MKESWPIFDDAPAVARPLWLVGERERGPWLEQQDAATTSWLQSARFRAERHQYVALPAADGTVRGAVLGLGGATSTEGLEPWWLAGAADRLPPGTWRIANDLDPAAATAAALGWGYGAYRFERYRAPNRPLPEQAKLAPPLNAE